MSCQDLLSGIMMPPSPDPWTPAKTIVTTPTPPTPRSLIVSTLIQNIHLTRPPHPFAHTQPLTNQSIPHTLTQTTHPPKFTRPLKSITHPSLTYNGKLRTRRRERRLRRWRQPARRQQQWRRPVRRHGQDYRPGYALPFSLLLPMSLLQRIFSVHRAPLV